MAEAKAPAPAEETKPGSKPDPGSDKKGDKKGEKKDAKAGGKKNPVVMGAILGGALLVLTAASYFVVTSMTGPADAGSEAAEPKKEKKKGEKVATFEVKDLVLNPAGNGVTHFAKISLVFETGNAKLLPELEERQYRVRDMLIRIIGRRTATELADADVREELRAQILDEVNSTVVEGGIEDVYFTDFIIQ